MKSVEFWVPRDALPFVSPSIDLEWSPDPEDCTREEPGSSAHV